MRKFICIIVLLSLIKFSAISNTDLIQTKVDYPINLNYHVGTIKGKEFKVYGGSLTKLGKMGGSLSAFSSYTYRGLNEITRSVDIAVVNDSFEYMYWFNSREGIVVGVFSNSTVIVFNWRGERIFKYALSQISGEGCVFVDFNKDGHTDFILADYVNNVISIYLFDVLKSGAILVNRTLTPFTISSMNITGLDWDGDGSYELVIIAPPKVMFYKVGVNGVNLVNSTNIQYQIDGFLTVDLDGDGREGIIVYGRNGSTALITEIDIVGSSVIKSTINVKLPNNLTKIYYSSGDYNGDGDDDLMYAFMNNITHANITILDELTLRFYSNLMDLAGASLAASIINVATLDWGNDGFDDPTFIYWVFPNKNLISYLNTSSSSLNTITDALYYVSYTLIDRNLDAIPEFAVQENNSGVSWIEIYNYSGSLIENLTLSNSNLELYDGAVLDPYYGKFVYHFKSGLCILRDRASSATLKLIQPSSDKLNISKNGSINVSWLTFLDWRAKNITVKLNSSVIWWNNKNYNSTVMINVTQQGIYNVSISLDVVDIGKIEVFFYMIYDYQAPLITSHVPKNNTYINNNTIEVKWNIIDNIKFKNIALLLNGSVITTSKNRTGSYTLNNLIEGKYNLTFLATDLAENNAKLSITFVVDLTPPYLKVLSPKNNSFTKSNVRLEYLALDAYGLDRLEVYDNNTLRKILAPNNTYFTLENLTNGIHRISLICFDKAGNSNATTLLINVDTTAPNINVGVSNNSRVPSTFNITFNVSDRNLKSLKIYLNGSLIVTYSTANLTNIIEINYQREGWVNITFFAEDKAGNTAKKILVLYVDITPPVIQILDPVNWTITNNTLMEITWITNESDLESVEISRNGSYITSVNSSINTVQIELYDGLNILEIRATDYVGNSYLISLYILLDRENPILDVKHQRFVNTTSVTLEVNATDNVGLDKIEIIYNNTRVTVLVGSFIYHLELLSGNNTIVVIAYDLAGNLMKDEFWIFVDLEPPVLRVLSPENGTYISNSTINLYLETADTGSGLKSIKVKLNESIIYQDTKINSSNITIIFSLDRDGLYFIHIYVFDLANNKAHLVLVIYRDTVPPKISNLTPKNGSLVAKSAYVNFTVNDVSAVTVDISVNGELVYSRTTYNGAVNVSIIFNEGINMIYVSILDKAGNIRMYTLIYTSDQRPPVISVKPSGDKFYVGDEVTFWVDVTDDYGISRIDVFLDGEYVGSLVEEFTKFKLSLIESGSHKVTFKAVDLVGNEASQVIVLSVYEKPESTDFLSVPVVALLLIISISLGLIYGYIKKN